MKFAGKEAALFAVPFWFPKLYTLKVDTPICIMYN